MTCRFSLLSHSFSYHDWEPPEHGHNTSDPSQPSEPPLDKPAISAFTMTALCRFHVVKCAKRKSPRRWPKSGIAFMMDTVYWKAKSRPKLSIVTGCPGFWSLARVPYCVSWKAPQKENRQLNLSIKRFETLIIGYGPQNITKRKSLALMMGTLLSNVYASRRWALVLRA